MPSVVSLAEISNAVYDPKTGSIQVEPPGGKAATFQIPSFTSSSSLSLLHQTNACLLAQQSETWLKSSSAYNSVGFYAGLYSCGGQRVIAFRGTDDLFDGLVDDVAVGIGVMPPQVIAAFRTVSAWAGASNTYLTGHSLGGALAILAACHFNLPAVTFNAPGVGDVCVQIAAVTNSLESLMAAVSRCARNSRVRNIRISGDPVSSHFTTGAQAGGNVTSYDSGSCGLDLLCRHGMATCLSAVKASSGNYSELTL